MYIHITPFVNRHSNITYVYIHITPFINGYSNSTSQQWTRILTPKLPLPSTVERKTFLILSIKIATTLQEVG